MHVSFVMVFLIQGGRNWCTLEFGESLYVGCFSKTYVPNFIKLCRIINSYEDYKFASSRWHMTFTEGHKVSREINVCNTVQYEWYEHLLFLFATLWQAERDWGGGRIGRVKQVSGSGINEGRRSLRNVTANLTKSSGQLCQASRPEHVPCTASACHIVLRSPIAFP